MYPVTESTMVVTFDAGRMPFRHVPDWVMMLQPVGGQTSPQTNETLIGARVQVTSADDKACPNH